MINTSKNVQTEPIADGREFTTKRSTFTVTTDAAPLSVGSGFDTVINTIKGLLIQVTYQEGNKIESGSTPIAGTISGKGLTVLMAEEVEEGIFKAHSAFAFPPG